MGGSSFAAKFDAQALFFEISTVPARNGTPARRPQYTRLAAHQLWTPLPPDRSASFVWRSEAHACRIPTASSLVCPQQWRENWRPRPKLENRARCPNPAIPHAACVGRLRTASQVGACSSPRLPPPLLPPQPPANPAAASRLKRSLRSPLLAPLLQVGDCTSPATAKLRCTPAAWPAGCSPAALSARSLRQRRRAKSAQPPCRAP
jgi:hypothetical protein